jgi:ABC-type amino acid transport substrate-binding protein
MRFFMIVVAAALAAGCASRPAPTAAAPGINLSGYPMEFRAGYADGCTSVDAARKRDEARFKTDASYAQGWRDGYDICRRRR